ncbi:MAG: class I SAM-dependent methyltransferase [Glaciecola sp.]
MSFKLILHPEREKSLLRKHPWIFDGAIAEEVGKPKLGATVDIISSDGKWLAKAAYSPESQIRARVWTFNQNTVIDNNFFKNRILKAYKKRQGLIENHLTNAYRLVAGESDGLPGITIDVYANVVVIQLLSAGPEKHRQKIIQALQGIYPNNCIHERSDVDVRKKEGLPLLVETHVGTLPANVIIEENGVKINVDLINGHKTGFYLDQRTNRHIAGRYCENKKVLNCFSYTGTFALYAMLNKAQSVTNLDVSQNALDNGRQNMALNFDANEQAKVSHVKADVFEQLRDYQKTGEKFDVIIMDPPKFIENKRHIVRAARGYKDINRLACELLNDNGILITFSCSGLMGSDLFNKVIADAALDANVSLNIIERLNQDKDHMTASSFPEGHYLKGLVCIKSSSV